MKNTLALGSRAKLFICLMEMVKSGGRARSRLTFRRNGRARCRGGDQLTEFSSLHHRSSSLVITGSMAKAGLSVFDCPCCPVWLGIPQPLLSVFTPIPAIQFRKSDVYGILSVI